MPTICSAGCGKTSGTCKGCSGGSNRFMEAYASIHPIASAEQRIEMHQMVLHVMREARGAFIAEAIADGHVELRVAE